jgi:hypothetical protein
MQAIGWRGAREVRGGKEGRGTRRREREGRGCWAARGGRGSGCGQHRARVGEVRWWGWEPASRPQEGEQWLKIDDAENKHPKKLL